MKKLVLSVAAFAFVAAAATAHADPQTATGTIKSIAKKPPAITLDDGKAYGLAKGVKLTGLKVGEKVNVTYDVVKGKTVASAVAEDK